MYAIININGLYLAQEDFNSYFFTDNLKLAIKFVAEENAQKKIKMLPLFKHLSPKKI